MSTESEQVRRLVGRTVHVHDDGIRPAGKPDECFYCRQKVGSDHLNNCVAVCKIVKIKYEYVIDIEVPHHWDAESIEFVKNESSSCANNTIQELVDARKAIEGGCLCGVFKATVVDSNMGAEPFIKIRLPPNPSDLRPANHTDTHQAPDSGSGASQLSDADGWPDPLPEVQTEEEQNRRDNHLREQIAIIQGAARATDNHGASNPGDHRPANQQPQLEAPPDSGSGASPCWTDLMYEDELPPMTDEQYREWYKKSKIVCGVRMGPIYPPNPSDQRAGASPAPMHRVVGCELSNGENI